MSGKKQVLIVFAVAASLAVSQMAQSASVCSGIKSAMPEDTFYASGLGTLTTDQLKVLDTWFSKYSRCASEASAQRPLVSPPEDTEPVRSRLGEGFTGWSGATVFRLQNGQRWRQRLSGRFIYLGPANPEVLITRNFLGFHTMTLIEADRAIGVSKLP